MPRACALIAARGCAAAVRIEFVRRSNSVLVADGGATLRRWAPCFLRSFRTCASLSTRKSIEFSTAPTPANLPAMSSNDDHPMRDEADGAPWADRSGDDRRSARRDRRGCSRLIKAPLFLSAWIKKNSLAHRISAGVYKRDWPIPGPLLKSAIFA